MIKKYFSLFLLLTFGAILKTSAQNLKLSDKTQISILTCDVGQELHTLFGHTAIRINDPENGFDAVYNFGYFDFATPNFYWKFVKGDLRYFVAVDSFDNFMSEYIYYNRGVYEQNLNLTTSEKQNIFEDLTKTLQSDEKFYTYKFIDKNCTTMIADLITKNSKTVISKNIKDQNITNRSILYGYLGNHFYENLGINVIFGTKVDQKFYKIFLPLQLLEALKMTKTIDNKPFCNSTKTLNIQSSEKHFSLLNNCFSLILVLLVIVVINKKWLTSTYLVILGLIGFFLIGVGFYSFHEEVWGNYNMFLFNPLYILITILLHSNNQKILKYLILLVAITLVLYFIFITTKPFILLFLPIIMANAILLFRNHYQIKNKKI